MGLSIRAYARHRGISHVSVLKAARAGRIPQEPDGTIDPAKADAAWDAHTDPARKAPAPTPPVKATPLSTSPSAVPSSTPPPSPPPRDAPAATGANFAQARTMHEVAKAQRLKDEVIDRAQALALVFKLARQERDAWVTWPARVAGQMAAEIGIDPHLMQVLLEAHVRAELADLKPEFR
jgi:hypothetical protein